jgi:hypothetical protein
MAFAEFWYGAVMERVYVTTTDFEGTRDADLINV